MSMATKIYQVDIDLEITPVWKHLAPQIRIILNDRVDWAGSILDTKSFQFSHLLPAGVHALKIELHDKSNVDPIQGIRISNLVMGKISSSKIIWQGKYRPRYPEPWAGQQRAQGIELLEELGNTDYLGWNGTWHLDFTVPVFTWIHQVENLGWIYD